MIGAKTYNDGTLELSFWTEEKMQILKTCHRMKHPLWKDAFKFYNNYNERQLHMNCGSCFQKVYWFIRKKLNENS